MNRARKIGVDLVEVARFGPFAKNPNHNFLRKFFTEREIFYCAKSANPAIHFAGTFAAKEAASKALGADRYPFIEFEIRRTKDGAPEAWRKGHKIAVQISISHSKKIAIAVALG
jgi:holo-[acyl-carrier protein] synthase